MQAPDPHISLHDIVAARQQQLEDEITERVALRFNLQRRHDKWDAYVKGMITGAVCATIMTAGLFLLLAI